MYNDTRQSPAAEAAPMLKLSTPFAVPELEQRVFAQVVPADHYLRQVQRDVDFERFRPRLTQAYSHTGRPGIDPVRMLKILFLCFHYRLSDRQVMARAQTDLAFRWFLQLRLDEKLPNHTSDTYFRNRIGVERFQQVFQDLVTQAREHGLVKDRLRLKDATHLFAAASDLTPRSLAAQVRERLLDAAEPLFPEWVAEQRARLETLRQTTAEHAEAEQLAARVEFLREMAAALRERVAAFSADDAKDAKRQRLANALALAEKLLADRDHPEVGDRLVNAVDAEARTGWHGGYFLGYLLDVAVDADSEIITAVNVLPGNGAEAADAVALIAQEESAQGNDVAGLSMDGAGYNGPMLRELTDPQGRNLEVTVPPPASPPRTTFGPERFALTVIDESTRELTCPNGATTRQHSRNPKDTGDRYVFAAEKCLGCPLRSDCLEKPLSSKGRTVIKNDYEAEYGQVAAKSKTPEYAAVRGEHPKVERKLGELVRHHGLRQARYCGQAKVLLQSCLTAMVVNVKRIVKLVSAPRGLPDAALPVRAELATI
jgi:transposase